MRGFKKSLQLSGAEVLRKGKNSIAIVNPEDIQSLTEALNRISALRKQTLRDTTRWAARVWLIKALKATRMAPYNLSTNWYMCHWLKDKTGQWRWHTWGWKRKIKGRAFARAGFLPALVKVGGTVDAKAAANVAIAAAKYSRFNESHTKEQSKVQADNFVPYIMTLNDKGASHGKYPAGRMSVKATERANREIVKKLRYYMRRYEREFRW